MVSVGHNESDMLRPEQNGQCFADKIFKGILCNENHHILIQISLKFVLMGLVDNNSALGLIMAWH